MVQDLKNLIADVKEQVAFLHELGVETIDAPMPEVTVHVIANSTVNPIVAAAEPVRMQTVRELPPETLVVAKPPQQRPGAGHRLASLPSLARRASTPGTQNAEIIAPAESIAAAPVMTNETIFAGTDGLPESAETMEQIWEDIGNCTRCPLNEGRTKIVQTVGDYQSDLMFIGEAPGADEDAKGEPFVGRAGQLLNKIIEAIGMKREEVCIGNINRCRPPGNRQPTLPEAHTCKPFLLREIAVIRPKVIVVMGNTALHNLLDTKVGITRMRGQFHDYFGVKVMPTFHPAYLLRDPSKKREVWDDMKMVKAYLTSLTK